jgi:hypothetical protein
MRRNRAINSCIGDSRGVLIYTLACQYPPEGYFPVRVIREPARASYSEPCRSMDISCEREGKKTIAGREAGGWRFRHAGSRGPDGSDSGTMWIDDEYGLLLGYHAEDMQGRSLDWTVTTVSFEPLAPELFELPDDGKNPDKQG